MPPLLHRQAEAGRLRRPRRALRAPVRQAEGQDVSALAAGRRTALLAAKVSALVKDHFPLGDDARPGTFPGGATLQDGGRGWILPEEKPARALGQALAWGRQQGLGEVHLLVDEADGLLARRAKAFADPPRIWRIDGRSLRPANPAPLPESQPLTAEVAELSRVIAAAGADPVVEHGVLVGEVAGLEVARAVVTDEGAVRLEVGVGRHDREAFQLLHGDLPKAEALAAVIRTVREHRRDGAEPHPLNRLASERWLRARLIADPALVGAATLAPMAPPVPRQNLKDPVPAPAVGTDGDGAPLLVVCSVGIDLDLVPTAADVRGAASIAGARLVLAVPERDDHPVTRALAAALTEPAEVRPVAFGA